MLLCCLWCDVEASCHTLRRRLPPSTNSTAYRRLVSSTRHGPSQLSVGLIHLLIQPFAARESPTPPAFDAPVRRVPVNWNISTMFGTVKIEWCGYSMVNEKKLEDMYSSGHSTRTDTARRQRPRFCVASRDNKHQT